MSGRRQRGFTIIELIMVFMILGLLSVVVLPRFMGIVTTAKQTAFHAIRAAFVEGVQVVHKSWIAKGSNGEMAIDLEGTSVLVNAAGWPRVDAGAGPGQDTAAELYSLMMSSPLPADWTSSESPVDYTWDTLSFRYDPSTGIVSVLP